MGRPVHFEIHAQNVERARDFYGAVFGWTFEDWTAFAGSPYLGCVTGPADAMGINGAIMQANGPLGGPGAPVNGAVLTMGVGDYDETHAKILAAGGQVALPKMALTGMAWQGYYLDTEGNTIGIHQPDPEAR